jgi:hypothetical protein
MLHMHVHVHGMCANQLRSMCMCMCMIQRCATLCVTVTAATPMEARVHGAAQKRRVLTPTRAVGITVTCAYGRRRPRRRPRRRRQRRHHRRPRRRRPRRRPQRRRHARSRCSLVNAGIKAPHWTVAPTTSTRLGRAISGNACGVLQGAGRVASAVMQNSKESPAAIVRPSARRSCPLCPARSDRIANIRAPARTVATGAPRHYCMHMLH